VEHDDMNVLTLGARVIGIETAASCSEAFLAAKFTGEPRHIRRVSKVNAIEAGGAEIAREAEVRRADKR
jgi:ribose 5-phosphate isomerase B